MIVKSERTVVDKFHIDREEQQRITKKTLGEEFGCYEGYFIKDGKLMQNVEYHTSHSWDTDEVIREATELDEAVLLIYKHLSI